MSSLFMRYPGNKAKALTLSYDDGVEQDERLMRILDKHGIKCTFNINSGTFTPEGTVFETGRIHRIMTEKVAVELYRDSGHEVAVHGLTHPWLEQLPTNIATYEIIQDRLNLERLFQRTIRGMAYPFGTFNDDVVAILKSAGIVYSRTVMDTEDFKLPTDWLRLPATCHHKNPKLQALTDRFITQTPKWEPWLFYLWGHSYEFEAEDNWNVIEDFSERIGGKSDIWYATNIQIYDYVEAYHRLQFSVDASIVHNPTSLTLYFEYSNQSYEIAPGDTLRLN